MFKKEKDPSLKVSMIMIIFVIVFYVLYIWASLIIPFIIALLFSFAIIGLNNFYKLFKLEYFNISNVVAFIIISTFIFFIFKLGILFLLFFILWTLLYFFIIWLWNHFNKLNLVSFFTFTLSLWTYIFLFWWIWKMIGSNLEDLIRLLPDYQAKVSMIITQVFEYLHLPEPTSLSEVLNKLDLQYLFTLVVSWFTSIFSSAWIILFYVLFILLEYRYFKKKLTLMIGNNSNKWELILIIEKIKTDIKSYFVIKSTVSLITALLSYIVMILFWLDFAIFWVMLIFILNFIPSIWSIIAVSFPVLLSLVQPEFWLYNSLIMTSALVWIQIMMWNIIEPKFMWNKLNLSPLVIIIALWFWWAMWGIVGMLLSVPIMVIINIILAKIPATRSFAILLSEKWELQVDWGEEIIKTRRRVMKKITEKFSKNKKI